MKKILATLTITALAILVPAASSQARTADSDRSTFYVSAPSQGQVTYSTSSPYEVCLKKVRYTRTRVLPSGVIIRYTRTRVIHNHCH